MRKIGLLIVATAFVVAACGSDKPAPSDDSTKMNDSAVTPAVAAPSADVEPSAPTARPAAAAKPAGGQTVEPAPPAVKPVVVPPPPPPAPVVTPTPPPVVTPPPAAAPGAPPVDPLAGKPLYDAQCRKCHGVIGVPPKVIKAKFPKILPFDAAYFSKTTDDEVVTILMQGKGDDMKSFKEKLTRPEMVAVAAYIRTLGQRP